MSDCIFCKIIGGSIPSYTIYENQEFKVILDRYPSSIGHTLVIPKCHAENIYELDEESAGRLFALAVKVAGILKEALNCDGMNVLQNNGVSAGQTVNHFHLHLIPRYKDDSVSICWKPLNPQDGDFKEIAGVLSEALSYRNKTKQ